MSEIVVKGAFATTVYLDKRCFCLISAQEFKYSGRGKLLHYPIRIDETNTFQFKFLF